MKLEPLNQSLSDWMDVEDAMWALAIALGLMTPETPYQTNAKHVFWSKNPIGDMLHEVLTRLVALGVLEYREEPYYQYRWNSSFKGSWERQYPN